MKSSAALALSMALAAAAAGGSSEYREAIRLEDRVSEAARIARVQLGSRAEVTYVRDGQTVTCGYRYHARVRSALRGGSSDFEFFSNQASTDEQVDHLVVIEEFSEKQRDDFLRRVVARMESPQRELVLCRLTEDLYRALAVMAFDDRAEKEFGGEWLRPLEPVYSSEELERRVPTGAGYEVLGWDSVRRLIDSVLQSR